MACSISMGIALGLRIAADKALVGKTGIAAALSTNVIAYTSVMVAGNANVYVMRAAE